VNREVPPPLPPEQLRAPDDVDALIAATTPEQIERIVAGWTRKAEQEVANLLAPAHALLQDGNTEAAFAAMQALFLEQTVEVQRLKMLGRLSKRLEFGKRNEKLDPDQLRLAFLAFEGEVGPDGVIPESPSVPTPDVAATELDAQDVAALGLAQEPVAEVPGSDAAPGPDAVPAEPKKRHGGGGRRPLAATLKRFEHPILIPAAERACVLCGVERTCVRHRECVRLEYVPGHVEVHVEKREVLACLPCRKDVSVAPREEPVRKVRAAPSLLTEFLILKCDDALPLHRVREQLLRLGIDLPKSTLGRWWDYVTALLGPLADVIIGRILAGDYMGVDDTGLLYLAPTDKGKKRPGAKGHLWCFVGNGPLVGFRFTRSWTADEIAVHLRLAEGFVQGDGYAGYGSEVDVDGQEGPLILDHMRLGCLTHARRPFHELVAAKDVRANPALLIFQSIYKLEAEYREKRLDHVARGRERLARSVPLFDKLSHWVHQLQPRLRPKDPLAKAVNYFINQESYLRRCFLDGRFELDNTRVERAIREIAIGRKNFVLTGSPEGGERLAIAYTVIETARRAIGTERLRPYLIDVITKLENGYPLADLHALLPDAWAANQAAQQLAGDILADAGTAQRGGA